MNYGVLSVLFLWVQSRLILTIIQLWYKNEPLKHCGNLPSPLSGKAAEANLREDYLWNHNQRFYSRHFSFETNVLYITS